MKKTIIYGGAFNPPTIAHQCILKACEKYAQNIGADLWIMPSGDRHDKQIPVTRSRRLEYINAMIKDLDSKSHEVSINTYELDRSISTNTYNTVIELSKKHPNRLFLWVFGADSIQNMNSWHMGDWLLNNLEILVIEREDYKWKNIAKKASLLDVKTPLISSTQVRHLIKNGYTIDRKVSRSVIKLLKK